MSITFPALKPEYEKLFNSCTIKPSWSSYVFDAIARFQTHRSRYAEVSAATGVPDYFVFLVHQMECSCNFNGHLHNGDRLSARTSHVPAGRPTKGSPPFTWEESAIDCLEYMEFNNWSWSTGIPGVLFCLEKQNGWGYRQYRNIYSPYLWSGSNHYTCGKYVADGRWDCNAVSQQLGAAVILKEMVKRGIIDFKSSQGGKATLKVVANSFLKQKPIQSSDLSADRKVAIKEGQQLQVLAYKKEGNHYRVTFDQQIEGFNTWLIYVEHVKISD